MTALDARAVPLDALSEEQIRAVGLSYRLIDTGDDAALTGFRRAGARGFLDSEPTEEQLAFGKDDYLTWRLIGVYDEASVLPVATLRSWVTPLTVPGGEVPMWAISSVTVAATHRRRGIARNLLEGELRSAAKAGVPIAGLTVSEATIYGRYGFAPALPVQEITVATTRAGWAAGTEAGRFEYLSPEELAADLTDIREKERLQRAGQIPAWKSRYLAMAGLYPDDKGKTRGVRYRDADGVTRGVLAYQLNEINDSFRFRLYISHLAAETPEALRALWGFAIQHDLVDEVAADLRPLDEPVRFLVRDQRAVTARVHDHGWLRILDVAEVLRARRYRAALDLVIRTTDPLDIAAGTWRLRVDADGVAEVTESSETPDFTLDVGTLSALYPGSISAEELRVAGRLEVSAEQAAILDDAFRDVRSPVLGIWY